MEPSKPKRKRKYFGMTSTEIAILGVLGILILCGVLGGGFIVLRMALTTSPLVQIAVQPTHTPLPTYSPLSEVNPESTLVNAEDLTFGGDYPKSAWQKAVCKSSAWSTKDGWEVPETEFVTKFAETCWLYPAKEIEIDESLYILGTQRQAYRLAESIRADRTSFLAMMSTQSEKTLKIQENSLWIGQGELPGLQASYIAMSVDEAVIFLSINGNSRFVDNDLAEVATAALNRLRQAQKP